MEIVKLEPTVFQQYPNLMNILYRTYKEEPFIMYGVMEQGVLNLICKSKNNVFYIENGEKIDVSNFHINENYEIVSFAEGDMQYSLNGGTAIAIRNGMEESLALVNEMDDDDPMKGNVVYTQYNPDKDIECELHFSHRSLLTTDVRERIYGYLLKNIQFVCINEEAKKKPFKHGFTSKKHQYYANLTVDSDSYDYELVALKEFGLFEYLHKGATSLLESDEVVRFSKGWYLTRSDECKFMWPLGMPYKQDSIIKWISDYGFSSNVPNDLISVYNGDHELLRRVSSILRDMKELDQDKEKLKDMVLLMKLHN